MHDIDAQISKITGQNNYMETLQKITGNIMTIDMEQYHSVHKKISACDFNIKVLLSRLAESETTDNGSSINAINDEYKRESTNINIKDGTFTMYQRKVGKKGKVKPPREIVAPGHNPPDLIKTQWFKSVKHIEKEVNKYFTNVFPNTLKPDEQTFAYLSTEIYKTSPEVLELQTIYDVKIANDEIFKNITQLRKCTNMIINLLLTPMYDVKGTIRKHWDKIERIFNSKAFQQTGLTCQEDIIDMLNQFIVAKYRATITGNNKHYAKLFLSVVGNDNVTNMDGARFIEIMDSIDLEKLDKNENVYKFASNAKELIHQIVNNENINAKDVIDKLNSSFNIEDPATVVDDHQESEDQPEVPATDDKYNNLL